jgi:hypothetical protein
VLKLDWEIYYEASQKCHDLAGELRVADKPVHDAVKNECAGMAGDANGCRQWGEKYDEVARQTMQGCTNLADALTSFGYVLSAVGYNYGIANRSNPAPPAPHVVEMAEHRVAIPTSVADNGIGVDKHDGGVGAFYDQFVTKVGDEFGKLPNGDKQKLEKAATVWRTFADHPTVIGSAGKIGEIRGLFDSVQDKKNLALILGHLDTLSAGATELASASQGLSMAVGDFRTGTIDARSSFESSINEAVAAIGIAVVGGLALAAISFGGSLVAAGGTVGVVVAETINAIRSAYQASKLYRVVGLAAATAGAAVALTAFERIPSMTDIAVKLSAIIVMKVYVNDVPGPGVEPGSEAIPNKDVTDEMARKLSQGIHPGEDCSEIAEHLKDVAGGVGEVLRVDPAAGKDLTVEEFGVPEEFEYHEVYSDGKYVYDPRHSPTPIPIEQWRRTIMGDNPGATIKVVG